MRAVTLTVLALLTVPAVAAPKDDLIATDKAFSDMSLAQGQHAAFLAFMTDDVRLFTGIHPPVIGKEAVAKLYADEEKSDSGYKDQRLQWTALEAEASPDGALGWTRGTWMLTLQKPDGSPAKLTGYYVTEWRRQADGKYKFCLDIGGADKH